MHLEVNLVHWHLSRHPPDRLIVQESDHLPCCDPTVLSQPSTNSPLFRCLDLFCRLLERALRQRSLILTLNPRVRPDRNCALDLQSTLR